MKTRFLLFMLCCGLLMSCGSDDDATPDGARGNFTAKIDGVTWSGSANTVITPVFTQFVVAIGAGNADQSAFALTLNMPSKSPGNFSTDNGDAFAATYTDPNRVTYKLSSGNLNITKFEENSISGTFSFTAFTPEKTINITEGVFTDVNIQ